MNIEAQDAVKAGYQLEMKKDGLKQVQSGDVKLTVTISPAHMDNNLYSDPMGQRYMAVMVPLNDDETPRLAPAPPCEDASRHTDLPEDGNKGKSLAGAAKLLAREIDIITYIRYLDNGFMFRGSVVEAAERWIEVRCGVTSCSQIIEGTPAGDLFISLRNDYYKWKNLPPVEIYNE